MLISLLVEFQKQIASNVNHTLQYKQNYILLFHEVIGGLVGKRKGHLSLLAVFLALLGLCVAQITATAPNLYILSDAFAKRTYSCIIGAAMSLLSLVPTFHHYRALALYLCCWNVLHSKVYYD